LVLEALHQVEDAARRQRRQALRAALSVERALRELPVARVDPIAGQMQHHRGLDRPAVMISAEIRRRDAVDVPEDRRQLGAAPGQPIDQQREGAQHLRAVASIGALARDLDRYEVTWPAMEA